jgi:hypothetical protein
MTSDQSQMISGQMMGIEACMLLKAASAQPTLAAS